MPRRPLTTSHSLGNQRFQGRTNWEAFIKVFLSLAVACGWSEDEKRVRLLSSVTGEAADYLFRTQPEAVFDSFVALKSALASRFGERTAPNTFVSKLESRRLQQDESLAEYIADLQRFTLRGSRRQTRRLGNRSRYVNFFVASRTKPSRCWSACRSLQTSPKRRPSSSDIGAFAPSTRPKLACGPWHTPVLPTSTASSPLWRRGWRPLSTQRSTVS